MITLREIRISKNLSLDKAASDLGIKGASLSRIERGKQHMSEKTLLKIASYFAMTPGQVIDSIPRGENLT